MFVSHAAAALAMRGRDRRTPVAAFFGGAFLLDFAWIGLSATGLDLTPWSDWSHSLAMTLVWATAFAACFWRYGRKTMLALWLIVASHFILDTLIQGATLYPGAPDSPQIPILFTTYAWLVQRGLTLIFMAIFVADEWRARSLTWRTAGSCVVVMILSFR